MPEPLTITILVDPRWRPGVVLEVEVDGAAQRDRVRPFSGDQRRRVGYGATPAQGCGYGLGPGSAYGAGFYGGGFYGVGAGALTFTTLGRFANGYHRVRVRAVDAAGNPGAWSDPPGSGGDFAVRSAPDPPGGVRVEGGAVVWEG